MCTGQKATVNSSGEKKEKLPGLREYTNSEKICTSGERYLMPSIYLEFSLKFQSNYQITPQIQIGKLFFFFLACLWIITV